MKIARGKNMNLRFLLVLGAALLISSGALAQQAAPDPYADLNKQVQEKLRALGFYAGPVNGDFGFNTQAALAQFQLSVPVPASGMLDDQTLTALGIEPVAQASAGASGDTPPGSSPTGERKPQSGELGGSCDALVGPEKDRCMQQGGTVEVGATPVREN